MPDRNEPGLDDRSDSLDAAATKVLGYLNFSNGKSDSAFLAQLDLLAAHAGFAESWEPLRTLLLSELARLKQSGGPFGDTGQAEAVLSLTMDELLPAYFKHHSDLLLHLEAVDYQNTFFLGRCFEAVLEQGSPWNDSGRVVSGALDRLNDFMGYRPLAVLENGRRMAPYEHERFRPLPLFVAGAGICTGPHKAVLDQTLELLRRTPSEILNSAHFDLSRLDELAVDVRAYDHDHPVFKRTNYLFGEWDPHLLDTSGYFRRFIVRKIILDALVDWVSTQPPEDDPVFDAGAVLCGTILMASSISGDSPACHDSSVTLTSLLPLVARQRDNFYLRMMESVSGERSRRLRTIQMQTQQPFGHVRQALNLYLSHYGARQVQNRHLANIYARMGHAKAAQEQADEIPSTAARFECEVQWRLTSADIAIEHGQLEDAGRLLREIEELLHRGIHCGAYVDPWNILGFQGNFPLFTAREDAIPDQRVEILLDQMERLFGTFAKALSEAAAQGQKELAKEISTRFEAMTDFWDQFAAHVIDDLPTVSGRESLESARHVAAALAEWRAAGEAAGDINFWRKHVSEFNSAKAYACVVEALLGRGDYVAAMALLVQWLSCSEEVGIESGPYSIHALLLEWMNKLTASDDGQPRTPADWTSIRRMFDFLEANAGEYWDVPQLGDAALAGVSRPKPGDSDVDGWDADGGDNWADEEDGEDDIFSAAYDEITYRDSTDDGVDGQIMDGASIPGTTEFEILNRELEPRIKFIMALAQLWQIAASALSNDFVTQSEASGAASADDADSTGDAASTGDASQTSHASGAGSADAVAAAPPGGATGLSPEQVDVLTSWWHRVRKLQKDLLHLMNSVWDHSIDEPGGDHDANVEFDIQLQTQFYMLNTIIATHINCRVAEIGLLTLIPDSVSQSELPEEEREMIEFCRAVMRQDIRSVQQRLGGQFRRLGRKPLLYVPLDNGGHPLQILVARTMQTDIRFLLRQLPRLGLFRETWHVVRLAHRMEKESRPEQMAVTEFDRIFRTALKNTTDCLIESAAKWRDGAFTEEELVSVVSEVLAHYRDQWKKHSRTMRLSSVESLRNVLMWEDVKRFIEEFGADLFHARSLTLGNVRTILHNGIEWFLEQLNEHDDPLHPSPLIDALNNDEIDVEDVVEILEVIYGSVVDKFDRFLEYNTTTTQSDYGEKFYVLLDFLRLEAAYDRDAWERIPEGIVHRSISMASRPEALEFLEQILEHESEEIADEHVERLAELETVYGVHLPAITDRLNERFVKPLAVNRMLALVESSMKTNPRNTEADEKFAEMRDEIDAYMEDMAGSAVDIPQWLQDVEREVNRLETPSDYIRPAELELNLPLVYVTEKEVREQLKIWGSAVQTGERARRKKNTRRRKKP